ncbi:hypothetical protein A2714_03385 [Candidatus Woesebacteria bacterium RIFCSPHIGHO2_01_FULL_38_9]|uniref:PEP-utilising enzyme mobile domain-containing protein n=2 Tax=Candidatus Woeseibacteriota TaxID=1752722 RepID=A0A1F7Y173_9BACT|nr:MAG: hypothetical protein A2714_03385 [Candidatus Woesebacteria bacterium RIFCSPHIGHO2_01_FULL_38_9]OGM63887.1 MAG: hypothetical protein A2893_00020 [Candidatus Woesebacteria bacterium RIFCSPLOWO2_01_FULL_39_25]
MKTNKGLQKNTSLQAWGDLTQKYFGKKLRVEERKDREAIYTLLKEFGLPYEKFYVFGHADQIKMEELQRAVGDLGFPYWISATPKVGQSDLTRLSKLGLSSDEDGWAFIQSLPKPSGYKVIVMQYPDNIQFKGTALISKSLSGIADFVKGDQHFQLTSGLTLSDPMLFNPQKILRYSTIVTKNYQDLLYSYISSRPGHFEFQYGTTPDKYTGLTFFDYEDELAYEDIDSLFEDLVIYLNGKTQEEGEEKVLVKGLPACLGKVVGNCKIVMSSDVDSYSKVKEGEILISDATNPDMTPIMSKVSAIVTDLGGVTSHAAIVCRELKIPCIVGAKNATEVLENGMLIEVDAFKGVVKFAK